MKKHLEDLIQIALNTLPETPTQPTIHIDATKDKSHGDFATNIALTLAKPLNRKPREIAEMIVKALPDSNKVSKVEIAGPGFINFFLSSQAIHSIVPDILTAGKNFGRCDYGKGKKILVEFVSSNPTGPLHVGHGRHAAFGAIVSDTLEAIGFNVHREYYVNDAGRQMDILAVSVWLRYLEECNETITFPANGYKGTYVNEIAQELIQEYGTKFIQPANLIFASLPKDEPEGGDKELYIDAVILRCKELLSPKSFEEIFDFSLKAILKDIRNDLEEFGVVYQEWFSERKFVNTTVVDKMLARMEKEGLVYEQEGAIWFKATEFGDEKDRVMQRANGQRTYFANDLAYHINKFERGFDFAIDIFGSDHHGYIPRMKAGLQANHIAGDRLNFLTVQFVTLYRHGEQVQMSTRSGSFVTLRELRQEVGNDAARYFYVMRRSEQHVEFDLDLAKSQSNDNPVFYIQYANARICSVFRQLTEKGMQYDQAQGLKRLELLVEAHEMELMTVLARYPEVVLTAGLQHEPHQLTNYLKELATAFHTYYNAHQFLVDDNDLCQARLTLIAATRQILANGLQLLGISTPETM